MANMYCHVSCTSVLVLVTMRVSQSGHVIQRVVWFVPLFKRLRCRKQCWQKAQRSEAPRTTKASLMKASGSFAVK